MYKSPLILVICLENGEPRGIHTETDCVNNSFVNNT